MKKGTLVGLAIILSLIGWVTFSILERDIPLGLDLQGGALLNYEYSFIEDATKMTTEERSNALERALTTIRNRVDPSGGEGISVSLVGDKWIEVQIPAARGKDQDDIVEKTTLRKKSVQRKMETPGQLTFHLEVKDPNDRRPGITQLHWKNPEKEKIFGPQRLELFFKDGVKYSGSRFDSQDNKGWVVDIKFDGPTAAKFYEITKISSETKKRTAIVLDGKIVTMLSSDNPIPDGSCYIHGDFNKESSAELASILLSGSMPIKVNMISESSVGPTLGKDSIEQSKFAISVGALAIVLFMLVYYRISGLIAVIAISMNIGLIMAIMIYTKLVLTLPGIAGLLLTLGMSVDASILIYERIREEVSSGKSPFLSIKDGFDRAFVTILDANITTIITAIILFNVGTQSIKGFATTLIIGIFASLFTALYVSKVLFHMFEELNILKKIKMMKVLSNPTFNFFKSSKLAITGSIIIIIVGMSLFINKGSLIYDVDFKGGISALIKLNDPISNEDMRKVLDQNGYGEIQIQNIQEEVLATNHTTFDKYNLRIDQESDVFKDYKQEDDKLDKFKSDILKIFKIKESTGIINLSMVGPSVAKDMIKKAIIAILGSMVVILVYVRLRFTEFRYGIAACVALMHDILISLACFGIWSYTPGGSKIDLSFVAALLTIVGYSLNDTIVLFDRIRENKSFEKARADAAAKDPKLEYTPIPFDDLLNQSINQTLSRTIWTSLTTLFSVSALFVFGGVVIHAFAFTMLVGVIAGTYSSIFIATPIVSMISKRQGNSLSQEGLSEMVEEKA